MSKIVQRHTSVINPKTGLAEWFHPGDKLPGWAEDMVTNPRVFQDPETRSGPKPESMITQTAKAANYGNMNIAMLDELLKERGLSLTGNKPEKVARLKQSDDATG